MTPTEIRERRCAYPLTVVELAALVGCSASAIRQWEHGRRTPRPAQVRALAAVLTPREACACSCHALKRRRAGVPNWRRGEIQDLKRLSDAGATPDEIAAHLATAHGIARSRAAVRSKAQQLGRSFYRVDEQFTASDVARLLGIDHKKVIRRIGSGALRATRHIGIVSNARTSWWRVERDDLLAFVDREAGVSFDPAKVRDRAVRDRAEAAITRRRTA